MKKSTNSMFMKNVIHQILNTKSTVILSSLLLVFTMCTKSPEAGSQGADFEANIAATLKDVQPVPEEQLAFFKGERNPIPERFQLLPLGEVKPKGWLYDLMKQDITTGFVAYLDDLAPDIMKGDDLFNTTRRNSLTDIPDVGDQVLTGAAWEISMQWWTGETLGNWWDGYMQNAWLTDEEPAKERIKEIVEYMLSTQDDDGYIGIYGEELRYNHKGSNGELWTQTTVFRMLVGYYELTQDERVLDAVEKAMALTMKEYGPTGKSPFKVGVDYGGVTHGLMMTDVCEMLFRITGKQEYRDYAVYLYEDFSRYPITRAMNDVRYEYLIEDSLFQSHSAHTYEHFRTLIHAYYATGYEELGNAYDGAMYKLSKTILPSGAGFGNEWLNKEEAKPDSTGAEVCGMFELGGFFESALQKSGDPAFGDMTEKLTFNGILGSRNQNGTGLVYCKTDNCYILNRKSPQSGYEHDDPRYKYSPTHADAAVCCNPSYSKHFPQFVRSMWMKGEDGLAAVLYGPGVVSTSFYGQQITIEEATNYPISDEIEFKISTAEPLELSIYLRIPGFAGSMEIETDGVVTEDNGYYKVTKTWSKGDVIKVDFNNETQVILTRNNSVYFQRGPLVYAYNIPHREETVKDYDVAGFNDYYAFPTEESYQNISLPDNYEFSFTQGDLDTYENPWYRDDTYLTGEIVNTETNQKEEVRLIPMGNTVLRRTTFPLKG